MCSKNVTDFERLSELILLEEFGESIFEDISAYILEEDVSKLEDAAVLADSFALSRTFSSKKPSTFKGVRVEKELQKTVYKPYTNSIHKSPVAQSVETPRVCFYCKKTGHQIRDCWKKTRDSNQRKTVCLVDKEITPVSSQRKFHPKGEGDVKMVILMSTLRNPEVNV